MNEATTMSEEKRPAAVVDAHSAAGLDDEALVARILDGDGWAEEALYRRYAPKLSTMLMRLVANRADAQDALQETFIAVLRDLPGLSDTSALGSWITTVGVRQAHRVFRKRRLFRRLGFDRGLDDCSLESLASGDADPEIRAELALLDARLAALPTKERIAWMLRHVEGETLPRVAQLTGCSLATAKRRVASASARLSQPPRSRSEGDDVEAP